MVQPESAVFSLHKIEIICPCMWRSWLTRYAIPIFTLRDDQYTTADSFNRADPLRWLCWKRTRWLCCRHSKMFVSTLPNDIWSVLCAWEYVHNSAVSAQTRFFRGNFEEKATQGLCAADAEQSSIYPEQIQANRKQKKFHRSEWCVEWINVL